MKPRWNSRAVGVAASAQLGGEVLKLVKFDLSLTEHFRPMDRMGRLYEQEREAIAIYFGTHTLQTSDGYVVGCYDVDALVEIKCNVWGISREEALCQVIDRHFTWLGRME